MRFDSYVPRPEREHALQHLLALGRVRLGDDGLRWGVGSEDVSGAWRDLFVERRRDQKGTMLVALVDDWERLGASGLRLPSFDPDVLVAIMGDAGHDSFTSFDFFDAHRLAWSLPFVAPTQGDSSAYLRPAATSTVDSGGDRVITGLAQSAVGPVEADVVAIAVETVGGYPTTDRLDIQDSNGFDRPSIEIAFLARGDAGLRPSRTYEVADGLIATDFELVQAQVPGRRCVSLGSGSGSAKLYAASLLLDCAVLISITDRILELGTDLAVVQLREAQANSQECSVGMAEVAMNLHQARLLARLALGELVRASDGFVHYSACAKLLCLDAAEHAVRAGIDLLGRGGSSTLGGLSTLRLYEQRLDRLAVWPVPRAAVRAHAGRAAAFGEITADSLKRPAQAAAVR